MPAAIAAPIVGGVVGKLFSGGGHGGGGGSAPSPYTPTSLYSPFGSVSGARNADGSIGYTTNAGLYNQFLPQLAGIARNGLNSGGWLGSLGPMGSLAASAPGVYSDYLGADNQGSLTQNAFNSASGIFGNLAALAGNRAANSLSGTSPLDTEGNNLLGQANSLFNSVNPQTTSQDTYNLLSSLSRPGDVSATQNLFNQLQSTGRLGLNQNGELGDIGGLALAQQQADNQRRLQSLQYGNDLYNQRMGLGGQIASLAPGFFGQAEANRGADVGFLNSLLGNALNSQGNAFSTSQDRFNLGANALGLGNNLTQDQLNLGAFGLGQLGNIQNGLMGLVNQSVGASGAQSGANLTNRQIQAGIDQNHANNNGALLGSLISAVGPQLLSMFA